MAAVTVSADAVLTIHTEVPATTVLLVMVASEIVTLLIESMSRLLVKVIPPAPVEARS
jgi:hypothetical protein